MSDLIDADGFRANVGIILMHHDQVFLGRRTGGRGWQFPQGGVRRGESLEQALYRELEEEIGLAKSDVSLLGQTERWLRYRLPARYVRRHQQRRAPGRRPLPHHEGYAILAEHGSEWAHPSGQSAGTGAARRPRAVMRSHHCGCGGCLPPGKARSTSSVSARAYTARLK